MKSLTNYISNSTLAILIFALVAVSSVASFFVAGKAMALPTTPPITGPVTPTPTISPFAYRVFVTSTSYTGNLGGLTGADTKCQERANAANLGGEWKAWLSIGTTNPGNSPQSRFVHSTAPYKLLNGVIVANNWEDLTDGTLQNPIGITENGDQELGLNVWTYTEPSGNRISGNSYSCHNWTTEGGALDNDLGIVGNNGYINNGWTTTLLNPPCSGKYQSSSPSIHLYCFEQPFVPTITPTNTPTLTPTATPTLRPTVTPTIRPTTTPTQKPSPTPTMKPTVTPTVKPTATPTVRPTVTPTATPTLGACTVFGSSILDQTGGDTYTAQLLTSTWGVGESPIYKLTKNGKFDKVEFYVSGNGLMQVKVVDAKGNVVSDQPVKTITGSAKWVTFDFTSEPIVKSGQSYTVLFRAAFGTVYVHRGNFWNWARKYYLKPCLN